MSDPSIVTHLHFQPVRVEGAVQGEHMELLVLVLIALHSRLLDIITLISEVHF